MPHSLARRFGTGFAMGTADLVPGVSGGTIALVAGVYDDLIDALSRFDSTAIGLAGRGRWRQLAGHLRLGFLLPLVAGILTAVLSLAGLLHDWLDDPVARPRLFAWFVGLVVASVVVVARRVVWTPRMVAAAGLGFVLGLAVALASPSRTPETITWAVVGGALALSAMILPGISGSFVLLLVGQYERALEAASERDLGTIAWFALGGILGLLVVVRALRWALRHHPNTTLAVLVGFIAGTLPRLWPWDACVGCATAEPYLPGAVDAVTGVLLATVGGVAVWLLGRGIDSPAPPPPADEPTR